MVRDFQPVPPKLMAQAEREVPIRLRVQAAAQRAEVFWVSFGVAIGGLILFALFDLGSCLVARANPVLRLLGLAVVDGRGEPATRLRLFGRAWITWMIVSIIIGLTSASLLLGVPSVAATIPKDASPVSLTHLATVLWTVLGVGLILLGAFIFFALRDPGRSLADRLTRTWLVPR
jgi:hypothetical protein